MAERVIPNKTEQFDLTKRLGGDHGWVKTYVPETQQHAAVENGVSPTQAHSQVITLNTPAHLIGEFFDKKVNPNIIVADINRGTSIARNRAPYVDSSVLIVAGTPEVIDNENAKTSLEQIPTYTIYNLDRNIQKNYWTDILHALNTYEEIVQETGESGRYTVFAAENCLCERTHNGMRTSRSLGVPHAHVLKVDHNDIEKMPSFDANMQKVDEEQEELERIGQGLADNVFAHLPPNAQTMLTDVMEGDNEKLKIRKRLARPFGYTMSLNPGISIDDFTDFMKAHHDAYAEIAEEFFNGKAQIPQPSYRLYIYREKEGNISLIISPEFSSNGGVMEAAKIKQDRSPEFKKPNEIIIWEENKRIKEGHEKLLSQ